MAILSSVLSASRLGYSPPSWKGKERTRNHIIVRGKSESGPRGFMAGGLRLRQPAQPFILNLATMSDDRETRRYMVSGRVQGVGFRWFVEREAAVLGITGWVRNRENGSVEVMATGTREQISRAAPPPARGPAGRAGR